MDNEEVTKNILNEQGITDIKQIDSYKAPVSNFLTPMISKKVNQGSNGGGMGFSLEQKLS